MVIIALLLMISTTYALSVDCTNMMQFAYDLGMPSKQPAIWIQIRVDCCTASGVTCSGSERVYQINWNILGLNGVINGTAIPSSVTYLSLEKNLLTGSIPSNLLSGLFYLSLYGNLMSGDLPSFPSTLQYLVVGAPGFPGNRFTGSLKLNQPIWLRINDNWIADVVIQDSNGLAGNCDLSNNPLLGNSNIVGLTMCTKGGLYSAGLLPVTRSTISTVKSTTTHFRTTAAAMRTSNAVTVDFTSTLVLTEILESSEDSTITTSDISTIAPALLMTESTTADSVMGEKLNYTTSDGKTANGTPTTVLGFTSIVGTVQFGQKKREFGVNLGMMIRVLVSGMILGAILNKFPFWREFERMMSKGNGRATARSQVF